MDVTFKEMKQRKAVGLDGVPNEVWRCLGTIRVTWLSNIFKRIRRQTRYPMTGEEILQFLSTRTKKLSKIALTIEK